MKEISLFFTISLFFFFFFPFSIKAQMMSGWRTNALSVDCQQSDQYFEKLGDQFMKKMMGEEQDKLMEKQMGEQLSKAMHIRMGKVVSGCLSGFNSWGDGMMMGWPMMGGWLGGWGGFYFWYFLLVQILVVLVLILIVVYLWKKIKS